MNSTGLVKYVSSLAALAICAACSGGLRPAQGDIAGAPPTAALKISHVGKMLFVNGRPITAAHFSPMLRYATSLPDRRAAIVPDRHGKKDFEYVFNYYGTYASIFNYPKAVKQIGSIYGDGGQGCTNVLYGYGKKIFWNVGGQDQITEYRVPQTPIKTLSVNYSFPTSCAMDTSGDLAVGIFFESGDGGGDVVIFKNATGSGTVMTTPLVAEYFDGYDNNGNLFADGFGSDGYFRLVELPKGSSAFETITTSNTVSFPGSVQWDGKYLTVFDQDASSIYQYTVSGTKAKLEGTVSFSGAGDCAQTWNVGSLVYCGDADKGAEVFKYPAGGSPVATLTGSFDEPLGVVAAQK